MLNKQLKLVVVSVITLLISGLLFWQGLGSNLDTQIPVKNSPKVENAILGEQVEPTQSGSIAKVKRVIDGDTIEVEYQGAVKKLRYIGVDTPETVDPHRPDGCYGKEASNENKRLLEGKEVILEKDVSETDRFGRLLRFVYLKLNDGSLLFVNDYLIRQGYAQASTYPPDVKFTDQFRKAEREARENNRGLWANCQS